MKKTIFSFFMSLFFLGVSYATTEDPVVKNIDVTKSNVQWKGQKVTGSHEGTIQIKSGELKFEGNMLVGGTILIDMTTIANSDLGEKGRGRLEGHLKSADFFAVDEFPEASLALTNVVSRGQAGSFKVQGNLTIKGITKPIKFNVNTENGMLKADLVIDRSEFNVRYGSGSFFDNLGDKTIYDEFELSASLMLDTEQ